MSERTWYLVKSSTFIGDAICRLLADAGHTVIPQNHIGDWGTPFGMLIEHLLDLGEAGARELGLGDWNGFYREARKKFDADQSFADRSRRRVVLLQSGDPETLAHWRRLIEISVEHFSKLYAALGVTLAPADVAGESTYNLLLAGVVAELEQAGINDAHLALD